MGTSYEKKNLQLGMNASTANGRLSKDIMWWLITECNRTTCHHCNETMTRETFSIEHVEPWLDSEDPVKMFFDLRNISFSHLKCNISAARKPLKSLLSKEERTSINNRNYYQRIPVEERQATRKRKYAEYGC